MSPTVASLATVGVLLFGTAQAQSSRLAPPAVPVEKAAAEPEMEIALTPLGRATWVSGDSRRFAQDWWFREQSAGGVEQLKFHHKYKDGWNVDLLGHAFFDENNYDVRFSVVNPDIGYFRAGFVEYRKYFDDQAGYYPLFSTTSYRVGRDLHLNLGSLHAEAGLTLPNWPVLTVGYEEQFKDGNKSLLEWGGVQQTLVEPTGFLPTGSVTKRIFPSVQHINETTHIFKAGVEHTLLGVHVKDQFHYEWNNNDTSRNDMVTLNLTTGLAKTQTFDEHHDHGAGFNTFTMDSQAAEKVYWSAGYLATNLGGNYGLHLITDGLPVAASDRFWVTNVVNLGEESQASNFNVMVGPFDGVVFSAGIRGEDTKTHGFADVIEANRTNPAGPRATTSSNARRKEFEGTLDLRYTRIPMTTLYANARFLDGQVDDTWLEEGDALGSIDLVRRTDVTRQNYTAGFDAAPSAHVSFSGRYRHSLRKNNHGNTVDINPDTGYPGLLTNEDLSSNDYMLKLSWRATGKLQTFLSYQYGTTGIHVRAHDINAPMENPPLVVPATDMDAGQFHARTYSASATWTPIARLYLTGVLNYQNALSDAFRNDATSFQPYRSKVTSVIATAGYAVNNNTDASLEYSYVHADSFTDHLSSALPPAGSVNNDFGLPYGTTSGQHGLAINFTRRISESRTARLGLDYFNFHDSATAGLSNYTAYGIIASYAMRF